MLQFEEVEHLWMSVGEEILPPSLPLKHAQSIDAIYVSYDKQL